MAVEIGNLIDPQLVRNLLDNASRLGKPDLVLECQVRLAQIEGSKYKSQLEREFWTAVRAAEELKTAEKGKTIRLTRTRQKVDRVGIEQCLIDWATAPGVTDGFQTLVTGGKADLTGEAIVVRHAEKFDIKVVNFAKKKLIEHGIDLATFSYSPRD
jgi:hypothetical protein